MDFTNYVIFIISLYFVISTPFKINMLVFEGRQQYGIIGPMIRYLILIFYYLLFTVSLYYVIKQIILNIYT